MEDAREGDRQQPQQVALEPVLQEDVPFKKGHDITAVRLADGRIAVVLRWVCESLNLDPQGQVQRIQRTAAIAGELLRVKVQPKAVGEKPKRGGGPQVMPVLTLRGFPTWILGINPGEVEEDPEHPEKAEHIRQMIIAYQVEAVDVLYNHFAQKVRPALPAPETATISAEPLAKPQEPEEADDQTLTTYYEDLAVWALWKASQHAQQWRGQVQGQLESLQIQLESEKAVTDIIPDILARLGPETITIQQQRQVQAYVRQLSEASSKHPATIYDELKTAFDCPRYQELKADEWPQVVSWFKVQLDRAKR